MSEVTPRDILLRVGGRTLAEHGVLAIAGAGRGRGLEIPYTFTRASTGAFVDPDGVGRVAASGVPRIDHTPYTAGGLTFTLSNGLVVPARGPLLEGARTQLVTNPENFGAWGVINTPTLTAGQADPFGGTAAYLIDDNDAANSEGILQAVSFTGDGVKAIAVFVKPNTAGVSAGVELREQPAGANRLQADIDWSGGVPSVLTSVGTMLGTPESWGNGWYRFLFQTTSLTLAGNTFNMHLRIGRDSVADVGSAYFFGANAWNATFPSSYQGPSGGATIRSADSLTVPFNWGPSADITVLARMYRPVWADVSGSIGGSFPGIFAAGTANPRTGMYSQNVIRRWTSIIQDATGNVQSSQAVPAGAEQIIAAQFKDLTTSAKTAIDVGSGYSAFSDLGRAITAFGSQTLRAGQLDTELYGVLLDLIIARGLFTRAEMLAIP